MERPNFVMLGGRDPQRVICPPTTRSTPGTHKHLCGCCGACWSHTNDNLRESHAHTCPGCGEMVWGKYWNLDEKDLAA